MRETIGGCLESRWSSEEKTDGAAGVLGAAAGAARVIPGMPVNLSQEQIQETLVLQMRLQQVCVCVCVCVCMCVRVGDRERFGCETASPYHTLFPPMARLQQTRRCGRESESEQETVMTTRGGCRV